MGEEAGEIVLLGFDDMMQGLTYPAKGAGHAGIQKLVAESRAGDDSRPAALRGGTIISIS